MNSFYFIFEVEPESDNPVIAHVSRGVSHIWVLSADIDEAREKAQAFLKDERWVINEEKDAYAITPEKIEEMGDDELANYKAAQLEGMKSKFYYWHRSE